MWESAFREIWILPHYPHDIVEEIESDILIFAYDTSLMASGSDPAETAAQLNRDLAKI